VFLGRDDSFVTPAQIAAMPPVDDKGHRQNSEQDAASRREGFEDPREQRILQLARSFGLTERETAVFELLMKGRSVPYIRDELVISKNTVATHVKHIYAKSGVHTRQELLDLM
ncbi:MAG: helix-turn-helix transcriptional regulator, partial [Berryella intestinalis]|uniref:helix-turn-helix transcriptional regulator n=1 Tax=Berryella intestinalis TaxID=1531429 RepID=UPI002A764E6F